MGGTSAERDVSLSSGKAVVAALETAGQDVVPIELGAGIDAIAAIANDARLVGQHDGDAVADRVGEPCPH